MQSLKSIRLAEVDNFFKQSFEQKKLIPLYHPGQKKKKNHHRDSRREERCSTCDIMLDQARSAQGKSDPRLSGPTTFAAALIAPDRA